MSNTYFQFRQFRIDQDRCAMKVSTDACIQGAWTPIRAGIRHVLDIGTGTGLLALMLAQRNPDLQIDALEMDAGAAAQAAENVVRSPFATQITVHHADARSFVAGQAYDLIICNPPFFKNSLHGPDAARNKARHDLTLQQEDLVVLLDRHLLPDGYASILWPAPEQVQWTLLAEQHGWSVAGELACKDREGMAVNRITGLFSRQPQPFSFDKLILKNGEGQYTPAFRSLLQPFYLHL